MTALHDSGMHVVFTMNPIPLHAFVRHCFFLNYMFPPPEGYVRYCLTPVRSPEEVHAYEWFWQVLSRGSAVPEFILPVHLDAEPSESPGGVDLEVTFGIDAHVDGDDVCVTVNYLRVTPDVEGIGDLLAARSPARWWIPLNWLSLSDVPIRPTTAATTLVTYSVASIRADSGLLESDIWPAVAIGVALDGIPGADPDRFGRGIDLTENPASEYVVHHSLPAAAVSTEVITRYIDLFVEDILMREAAGETLFGINEDGFDYQITSLDYDWPEVFGELVSFTAIGRIHFLGEWRDMELVGDIGFVPDYRIENTVMQMQMRAHLPDGLHLIHEPGLEPDLYRAIGERYHWFFSQDSYSAQAQLAYRPDTLGTRHFTGAEITPFEVAFVQGSPYGFVDFDPDMAAIETDKSEMEIDFTYHYVEHFRTCSGAIRPWADKRQWGSFRVSNTGGVPVGIAVTTDRPDLLNLRGGTRTLLPGETVDISVEFRTDHLPRFYRSDAQEHFDANIYVRHSACNVEQPIQVGFSAHVNYKRIKGHRRSDAERNALCGFADVMMFKYGILALGDDAFDDHPDYTPVYTVSIRDEEDRYEFLAQDESGTLVAMETPHSLYKTMQIPVSEDDSIPLEVRYRASGEPAKGPFYWTMRGFFIEPAAKVKIDGFNALTPFSGGAVAVGPAGVFLLDTTAPRRSAARLALKDEQSLVDVASSRTDIYAVGDDRLLIMNVSGEGKIDVVQGMTLSSSAHLIRQLGGRLWVAGQDQLTVFTHQHGKEIEQVATTKLKSPARDISLHRGWITLLVDGGLHFYVCDGAELKLAGTYNLKGSRNAALTARGELVGVTDPNKGTFFLDVSHGKEPEIVARYTQPYWKSNLAIDIMRGITYSTDPRNAMANIGRFRALKIRR